MATSPQNGLQPAFVRVAQSERHDDALAVVAMLAHTDLQQIRQQAEVFGLPQRGPFYPYIDGDMIAKLLTSRGLVGTVWKECKSFSELPDVAIAMCDYDEAYEVGRCVLFHRLSGEGAKAIQYVLDPYNHSDAKLHFRTDLAELVPSWYIGVHQAPSAKPKGK